MITRNAIPLLGLVNSLALLTNYVLAAERRICQGEIHLKSKSVQEAKRMCGLLELKIKHLHALH